MPGILPERAWNGVGRRRVSWMPNRKKVSDRQKVGIEKENVLVSGCEDPIFVQI